MGATTKLRLAAFGTVIGILGLTFGYVGSHVAMDKTAGCVSPSYASVAYGVCR
jgi:hypothetical protein